MNSLMDLKCYQCPECDYTTDVKSRLKRHSIIHTGERPHPCPLCPYRAPYKHSLIIHLRSHTGERPIKCPLCDWTTRHHSHLTRHMRQHTGEKPFKCPHCDYSAARKIFVTRHLKTHTASMLYKCAFCDYKSATTKNIAAHSKREHDDVLNAGLLPYLDFGKSTNDHIAQKIEYFITHLKMVHGASNTFTCTHCEFDTTSEESYMNHLKLHDDESFIENFLVCNKCGFTMNNQKIVVHRSMIVRKEKGEILFCPYCEFRTPWRSSYIGHLSTHAGYKPYQCSHCEYRSSYSSDIKRHAKRHTGEKPHQCPDCTYSTSRYENLKTHMTIHAKSKRFNPTIVHVL